MKKSLEICFRILGRRDAADLRHLQRKFVIVDAIASLTSDLRLCSRIRHKNGRSASIRVKLASDLPDPCPDLAETCPDLTDPRPDPPDLTKIHGIVVTTAPECARSERSASVTARVTPQFCFGIRFGTSCDGFSKSDEHLSNQASLFVLRRNISQIGAFHVIAAL